jgi:hypothetical protein
MPVEKEALIMDLLSMMKLPSVKQEWNRGIWGVCVIQISIGFQERSNGSVSEQNLPIDGE